MSSSNRKLLDSFPWHETPLGSATGWPPEMRSVIQTMMASDFPLCTVWGEEVIQIYNDGFSPLIGDSHPMSFGAPFNRACPGTGPSIRGAFEQVRQTGEPHVLRDVALSLTQDDASAANRFDLSIGAVPSLNGDITGLLLIATASTGAGRGAQPASPDTAYSDARHLRAVAHDLNNLLTVILGSLDMLEESLVGEADLKLQTNALRAAEEAIARTNQLLVAARKATAAQQPSDDLS